MCRDPAEAIDLRNLPYPEQKLKNIMIKDILKEEEEERKRRRGNDAAVCGRRPAACCC
jgi:hypothetical protein